MKPSHPRGAKALKILYNEYKQNARRAGRAFKLPFEYFKTLVMSNCHYCGQIPKAKRHDYKRSHPNWSRVNFIYFNGIDRKHQGLGYTLKNCVPACKDCNFSKGKMSYQDFLRWVQRISEKMFQSTSKSRR